MLSISINNDFRRLNSPWFDSRSKDGSLIDCCVLCAPISFANSTAAASVETEMLLMIWVWSCLDMLDDEMLEFRLNRTGVERAKDAYNATTANG